MKRLIFLLFVLLLLVGCLRLPRESFEIVRYTFHPSDLAGAADVTYDQALLIMPFTSSSVQPGDRIVYRNSGQEMATYYYHRWIAAPQLLLGDLLSEDLTESELFEDGVYVMTSSVAPSHELHGRLVHLYADNNRGEEAAVMEILISVFELDSKTYTKELVMQKPYRYRIERENDKVNSYVPAVTEAVGQWLVDLRGDLTNLLEEGSRAPVLKPSEM